MTETARAWRTEKAGSLARLALVPRPLAPVEAGKVRVATRAVGLNFADVFALLGLYSATPNGAFTPGLECAGVVTAVGAGVTDVKAGDAVMAVTRFGGYDTHVDVAPAYCVSLPTGWSFAEGAAWPVQALTAWYALRHLGDLRAGQTVLVHSAAGGVGLHAMAMAKKLGARPIGSVGSEDKRAFLAARGFGDVFVRDGATTPAVKALLGGSDLNLVLEAIGGRLFKESYDLLAPTGRLVVFGAAQFAPKGQRVAWLSAAKAWLTRPRLDPLAMISDNKSVMGFNLIWLWDKVELLAPLLAELRALDLGAPHVGRVFPFASALEALEFLKSGRSVGKVVLEVTP